MKITKDLYLCFLNLDAIYPSVTREGYFTVLMENGKTFEITEDQKDAIFAKEDELRAEVKKRQEAEAKDHPLKLFFNDAMERIHSKPGEAPSESTSNWPDHIGEPK